MQGEKVSTFELILNKVQLLLLLQNITFSVSSLRCLLLNVHEKETF